MVRAARLSAYLLLLLACGDSHDVGPEAGIDAGGLDGGGWDELDATAAIDAQGCRPDADYLVGGGRSTTGCSGECGFDLTLASVLELGSGRCIGYAATLRVSNERGEPLTVVRADLSDSAWDRAAIIAARLKLEVLDRRYGCPDCATTAAWVLTRAGDEARSHAFPSGRPPAELAAAHGFVEGLIAQLRTCEGPDLLACSR